MPALKAGAIYFALVFAVGWVLGPIRVLWLTPRFGPLASLLLEAPVLVVAMVVAARWTARRFGIPPALKGRAAMGVVALGLLLLAEIAGALWLRGVTFSGYLAGFLELPGALTLLLYLLFAAMPAMVARR